MTYKNELIKAVENHFAGYTIDTAMLKCNYSNLSKEESYQCDCAIRLIISYDDYISGKINKYDFEAVLRQYLILLETSIRIPGYKIIENNPFGLFLDDNGEISVSLSFPTFLNQKFIRNAFMKDISFEKILNDKSTVTNGFIRNISGYKSYRSQEQQLAVVGALKAPDGNTMLISMLTGGGKSLVTQAVSYQKSYGLTIIVVPTVSLMLDQVRGAKAQINSDVENEVFYYNSSSDISLFITALHNKTARMLFISPESLIRNELLRKELFQANEEHYLKNFIVDEAHVIIGWGTSFRKEFQCLNVLQKKFLSFNPELRTYLLSATYTSSDSAVLKSLFCVEDRWIELRFDKLRKEQRYNIVKTYGYKDKTEKMINCVCKLPRPMIIYVNSPYDAEELRNTLYDTGFSNVETFTGDTSSDERERLIKEWAENKFDLMIATSAFGVGVDKKDVRTVLHLYVPTSANQYYQECGRGGRDGLPCLAIMLYTDDDLHSAFSLSAKVITTEKLSRRWFSMINSNKASLSVDEFVLDTAVKPDFLEDKEFWIFANSGDVSWNTYVILLLRRYSLIEIKDVEYRNDRYFFVIRLIDQHIRINDDYTNQIFDEIREKEKSISSEEFQIMRNALNSAGDVCISELFNSVYKLTDEYCSGCNQHDYIVDYSDNFDMLKKAVKSPTFLSDKRIRNITSNKNEMVIYSDHDENAILEYLSLKGLDVAVVDDVTKYTDANFDKDNTKLLIVDFKDYLRLLSKNNYYYTSGGVAFFANGNIKMIERILSMRSKMDNTIILVCDDDVFIPIYNKNLSEIIDGTCVKFSLLKGAD